MNKIKINAQNVVMDILLLKTNSDAVRIKIKLEDLKNYKNNNRSWISLKINPKNKQSKKPENQKWKND